MLGVEKLKKIPRPGKGAGTSLLKVSIAGRDYFLRI
jgi:hypothetical protein